MEIGIKGNWTTFTILVWGGLLAGLGIHGARYPNSHTVYNIYGPSARNWWAGRDLYTPIIKEWEEAGGYAATTDYFRYSPLFAISVTPFAILPDFLGNPLWKLYNCAIFLAGIWCACRWLYPAKLSQTQTAMIFLLALPTALTSIYNGQANLLMVGTMLLGITAAACQRWNSAAGCVAIATFIKGYPLALGLLIGMLYPKRFLPRYAGALLVGLLLPFFTHWPGIVMAQYSSWLDHMWDSTGLMRERLRSINYLFQVYSQPLSSQSYALAELLAGGIVLGWSFLITKRTTISRERFTWLFMLFATWVILFGPATESCTYVMISPVMAWCLIDAFRRPTFWGIRVFLMVSLIMMGPMATDLFGSTIRMWAHRYGSQPWGGVLLLVHLIIQTILSFRTSGQSQETHVDAVPIAA